MTNDEFRMIMGWAAASVAIQIRPDAAQVEAYALEFAGSWSAEDFIGALHECTTAESEYFPSIKEINRSRTEAYRNHDRPGARDVPRLCLKVLGRPARASLAAPRRSGQPDERKTFHEWLQSLPHSSESTEGTYEWALKCWGFDAKSWAAYVAKSGLDASPIDNFKPWNESAVPF